MVADIVSISGRPCKQMTFNFKSEMILSHLLPMDKKHEHKDHEIYSKMLKKICKRKPNIKLIRAMKNSSFDQHVAYIWSKTFLNISCCLVPCSEHFLVSSAALLCKTLNISTLSSLVYSFIKTAFFLY